MGWLRSEPDNIGYVITVRSGGFLTFKDDPDDEASDRYSDVIWQETFPLWGEDDPDGEPSELFDADVLLRLILKHPQPFKALLAADNASVCEVADESKNAFLVDFYRY